MTEASDRAPTRRRVLGGKGGPLVVEIGATTLRIRPYRSRSGESAVAIEWGKLYDRIVAEKAGIRRR